MRQRESWSNQASRLLGVVLLWAVGACHSKDAIGSATVASTAAASSVAVAPTPPACHHRRPFFFPKDAKAAELNLPPPFDHFTACTVLKAIFPDYEPTTEKAASSVGTVRIDAVRRWDFRGRSLLAVLFYRGADAEAEFVGGDFVAAYLAVVESTGVNLTRVAGPIEPWRPGEDVYAMNGQAVFDPAEYAFTSEEPLLAVRVPWRLAMMGTSTDLFLLRLDGGELRVVFNHEVDLYANGMGQEEDDDVKSTVVVVPRQSGPNDLSLRTTETRCHSVEDSDEPACGTPRSVGVQQWRFDGMAYRRIQGKDPPRPGVIHRLWGS